MPEFDGLQSCCTLIHLTRYYLHTRPDLVWSAALVLLTDIRIILYALLFSACGVYAGVRLWLVHPHALRSVNRFFDAAAVFIGVGFLAYTILFLVLDIPSSAAPKEAYTDVMIETIGELSYVVLWKLYLRYSDRVKATYES